MNKVWKTILIVICIVVIGVESFLLVKSFLKNNETIDANNTLEQELENVSKENNQITTDYLLTLIDDHKLNILDQFISSLDFKEVDVQKKLMYAYLYLLDKNDFSKGVSQKTIEKLLLKVFGDDKVEHQSIVCDCGKTIVDYDSKEGIYKLSSNHLGHGGPDFAYGSTYNKVVSLTISNNQYKLVLNKLFVDVLNNAYSAASLDEGSFLFENDDDLTVDDIIKKYEATYEEYTDKLVKYSYTFEKKNNKFILIKYEILD